MAKRVSISLLCGLGLIRVAHADPVSVMQLTGTGDQIYTCQAASGAFAWTLKGPEAVLRDDKGAVVGRHFTGPSWQASDGGAIVGEPLVASPSPEPGAIAWLVLHVKSKTGAGRFDQVAYVTRTATHGGVAPKAGCDAGHVGAEIRVAYSATYTFFSAATP